MNAEQLSAQLVDGVVLMVLGMAVVFTFLVILVVVTKLMSALVKKFSKPEVATVPQRKISNNNEDAQIAIALAAAVSHQKR